VRPDPAEVATMLLSGGTTSLSKLIPRTHDDYVLNARLCGRGRRVRREHRADGDLCRSAHNYNLASPGMLGAFYYGRHRRAGRRRARPPTWFGLVERERGRRSPPSCRLISAWLASDALDRFDLSSLEG
jgi:2,3-dihydroxybenzoate-AMP ligase